MKVIKKKKLSYIKWSQLGGKCRSILVRRANSKIQLLQKIASFTWDLEELIIRSILEQSCVVLHSSLTIEESTNLEKVQNSALKTFYLKSMLNLKKKKKPKSKPKVPLWEMNIFVWNCFMKYCQAWKTIWITAPRK